MPGKTRPPRAKREGNDLGLICALTQIRTFLPPRAKVGSTPGRASTLRARGVEGSQDSNATTFTDVPRKFLYISLELARRFADTTNASSVPQHSNRRPCDLLGTRTLSTCSEGDGFCAACEVSDVGSGTERTGSRAPDGSG